MTWHDAGQAVYTYVQAGICEHAWELISFWLDNPVGRVLFYGANHDMHDVDTEDYDKKVVAMWDQAEVFDGRLSGCSATSRSVGPLSLY